MEELVSVIMPNYNGSRFIADSIESVLAQSYNNFELLVVDDCSTDNSVEIIKSYIEKDDRIRLFVNQKNGGTAVSRNKAIAEAKGKWMAFLDSDDIWLPEKLKKHIRFMEEHDYAFSCTDYYVIDDNSSEKSIFSISQEYLSYKNTLHTSCIGCLTAIYNVEKLGKFYMPEEAVKREDYACWLNVLKKELCYCMHEPLSKYRVHNIVRSVSSNKLKLIKWQWNVYFNVEKINFFKSCFYMLSWAYYGMKSINNIIIAKVLHRYASVKDFFHIKTLFDIKKLHCVP